MKKKSKAGLSGYCFRVDAYQKKVPEITWLLRVRGITQPRIIMEESMQRSTSICIHPVSLRDLPDYTKNRRILPLEEHFSKSDLYSYFPLALDICRVDGKLMAIPEDFSPFALFYRKDLLQKHDLEAPKTLKELQTQLEFLKRKTGKSHFHVQGGGIITRLGFICSVLGSFGINLNENLESWSHELMIEGYEWVRQLHQKKLIPNFDFFIRQLQPPVGQDEFTQEKLAYSATWMKTGYRFLNTSSPNGIEMQLLPAAHPRVDPCCPMVGYGWAIPINTQDPQTAVKVLKKTQSRDLIKGNELAGGHPFVAWEDLWDDPDIRKMNRVYHWVEIIRGIKQGCLISNFIRKFVLLDEHFRQALRENLNGKDWLRTLFTREFSTTRKLVTDDVVKRSLEFMEKNLSTIHSIKQVADHVKMSPDYFRHFFQKKMKIGCGAYLMKVRMERAQQLLKDGKFSVKEISRELGFRYPQVFAKAFRKHCGKSPSEATRRLK